MSTFHKAPHALRGPQRLRRSGVRILRWLGQALLGAGVVVLLFVGYELWGTGLYTSRAQSEARASFEADLEAVAAMDGAVLEALKTPAQSSAAAPLPPGAQVSPQLDELLAPQAGEPVAVLQIPRIGLDKVVVEGVTGPDLRKGPGRYSDSPLPGQAGNAAIAGHRTTYGAPFLDLDQLAPGDEILVTTVLGTAAYRVDAEPFVVAPEQVEVLTDYGDNRLTLTTCNPKYSEAERLIVTASLVGAPFRAPPRNPPSMEVAASGTTLPAGVSASTSTSTAAEAGPNPQPTVAASANESATDLDLQQGRGTNRDAKMTVAWAAVTLLAATASAFAARWWSSRGGRRTLRLLCVYAIAAPPLLAALFLTFDSLDRWLPAL